jgi:hypothetical protein
VELREIGELCVYWCYLDQGSKNLQAIMNTEINLLIPKKIYS